MTDAAKCFQFPVSPKGGGNAETVKRCVSGNSLGNTRKHPETVVPNQMGIERSEEKT
jgi:hypothetical protein